MDSRLSCRLVGEKGKCFGVGGLWYGEFTLRRSTNSGVEPLRGSVTAFISLLCGFKEISGSNISLNAPALPFEA
jgi:hypothetical protein